MTHNKKRSAIKGIWSRSLTANLDGSVKLEEVRLRQEDPLGLDAELPDLGLRQLHLPRAPPPAVQQPTDDVVELRRLDCPHRALRHHHFAISTLSLLGSNFNFFDFSLVFASRVRKLLGFGIGEGIDVENAFLIFFLFLIFFGEEKARGFQGCRLLTVERFGPQKRLRSCGESEPRTDLGFGYGPVG